ncbi:FTR1 family protein [Streptomyces kanasensis]|uniref:FTR1 family protein n=1 Tax=Streptomyces kanasensis TaxID=936756 RepID=UPI0036FE773F
MLGSHLAGLRGGLETALLLGLLAVWLVRDGRGDRSRALWRGAAAGAVAVLALGAVLEFGPRELTPTAWRVLGGVPSVAAVACVALAVLRPGGVRPGFAAVTAFLVVAREGLATAVFVWATVSAARDGAGSAGPLGMVLLGLAVAALLGWAVHAGVRRLPPRRSAAWTGRALLVVAAGVLAQGVRELQDAVAPGGGWAGRAFDLGGAVSPERWPGALLEGAFGVRPDPSVLQVAVWVLFLVPAFVRAPAPVGFGRSLPVGVEEQKRTDARAGGGAGPGAGPQAARRGGGGGGADPGGERVRDGARRAGGGTDGHAG